MAILYVNTPGTKLNRICVGFKLPLRSTIPFYSIRKMLIEIVLLKICTVTSRTVFKHFYRGKILYCTFILN